MNSKRVGGKQAIEQTANENCNYSPFTYFALFGRRLADGNGFCHRVRHCVFPVVQSTLDSILVQFFVDNQRKFEQESADNTCRYEIVARLCARGFQEKLGLNIEVLKE